MNEQEIAKFIEEYEDYIDTLLGNNGFDNQKLLLDYRSNLRYEAGRKIKSKNQDGFYLIEAKTFLKYKELCQRRK